jgi:WD40 repeat protein
MVTGEKEHSDTAPVASKPAGCGQWVLWYLASGIGLTVLWLVIIVCIISVLMAAYGSPLTGPALAFSPFVLIGSAVAGALTGAAQWLCLRRYFPKAGWWVLVTTGGLTVGSGMGWAGGWALAGAEHVPSAIPGVATTWLAGLVGGIAQWLYLRRHVKRAGWWVPASTLMVGIPVAGGAVAAWVLSRLLQSVPLRVKPSPKRRGVLVGGAIGLGIGGAIGLVGYLLFSFIWIAIAGPYYDPDRMILVLPIYLGIPMAVGAALGAMISFVVARWRGLSPTWKVGIIGVPLVILLVAIGWLGVKPLLLGVKPPPQCEEQGHAREVNGIAWSPDGTMLATSSGDSFNLGTVIVWDAETYEPLRNITAEAQLRSVAWSPDGTMLAAGGGTPGNGYVFIWNVETGEKLHTLHGHDEHVNTIAWAPDGTLLASGSDDHKVIIWDAHAGAKIRTLEARWVNTVAWSPDGSKLAAAHSGDVTIWDAETGERIRTLLGPEGVAECVAWSPDGTRLVSGHNDETVRVWNAETGEQLLVLRGPAMVNSVAWSSDGKYLASGSNTSSIIIWDAETGERVNLLEGHSFWVYAVAFSPDSQMLGSGSCAEEDFGGYCPRGEIIVWDIKTGEPQWSYGREQTASGTNGAEAEKEVVRGEPMLTLTRHTAPIRSVAWSPDGTRLTTIGEDLRVIMWDAETGEPLFTLEERYASRVTWSPDGTMVAGGWVDGSSGNGELFILDAETGDELLFLEKANSRFPWSPDGTRLVTWYKVTVNVWDVSSGEQLHTLEGHSEWVHEVAFSPDGTWLATRSHRDKTIIIWDVVTGNRLHTLEGSRTMAWSPDGTRLAYGMNDVVVLWDAENGKQLLVLEGHTDDVDTVAWSPDGTRLASGSDNSVIIWDIGTGESVRTLKGEEGAYLSRLYWSPDGTRLASDWWEEIMIVWDVDSGEQLLSVEGDSPAWSPDGRYLACLSGFDVDIWELP